MLTQDPSLITTFSPHAPQTRTQRTVVLRPLLTHCPYCHQRLVVQKSSARRTVHDLHEDVILRHVIMACPNHACPARTRDANGNGGTPFQARSHELTQLALPHRHYSLAVLLKIGQLTIREHLTAKEIKNRLRREFNLALSESTVTRYRALYGATCHAVVIKNAARIRERLDQLPLKAYVIDATQTTDHVAFYRCVDVLTGTFLGGVFVEVGARRNLRDWLEQLKITFGTPAVVISDAEEAILRAVKEVFAVPHQVCWQHFLANRYKELLSPVVTTVKALLQKHQYRKKLLAAQAILTSQPPSETTEFSQQLAQLLHVLITDPVGAKPWHPAVIKKLSYLREAVTVLNECERGMKAQRHDAYRDASEFQALRSLKERWASQERGDFASIPELDRHPVLKAFHVAHEVVTALTSDPAFTAAWQQWKALDREVQRLRSFFLELHRRRLDELLPQLAHPQTLVERHWQQRLTRVRDVTQRELAAIPPSRRAWYRDEDVAALPLTDQAAVHFRRLITRWEALQARLPVVKAGIQQLRRYQDQLLVFVRVPLVPPTNQVIETNHGRLKELFRRGSGRRETGRDLKYHGMGYSQALNFETIAGVPSPLEVLGFSREETATWFRQLSDAEWKDVSTTVTTAREQHRVRVAVAKSSVREHFSTLSQAAMAWKADQIESILEKDRDPSRGNGNSFTIDVT